MKHASDAFAEIESEYDAKPDGWRIYMGLDSAQLPTLYVFHNEYAWTVKYPRFGMNGLADKVKIEEDELVQEIVKDPLSFGLRQLSVYSLNKILRRLGKGTLNKEQKQKLKPVPAKEINEQRNKPCITGPYLQYANSQLSPISQSQIDLEIKLRNAINHLTDGMYL